MNIQLCPIIYNISIYHKDYIQGHTEVKWHPYDDTLPMPVQDKDLGHTGPHNYMLLVQLYVSLDCATFLLCKLIVNICNLL